MYEIIIKALSQLKGSSGLFYVFPTLLAIAVGVYTMFCDPFLDLFGDVAGPIGVFSALMFSVIFIVVDHFLKRKKNFSSTSDEDKRYIGNYKDFTHKIVVLISFSIFLSGWIIFLVFLLPRIDFTNVWWQSIRNSFFTFFLLQYVALVVIVVKDMYAMLIDDIEKD